MESKQFNEEVFDENHSLQLIKQMIQVSHRKLKYDGILFIACGWVMFITSVLNYLESRIFIPFRLNRIMDFTGISLGLLVLAFTIWYILKQRKKVQTYIGISLRYIWVSMFFCLVLINLIQFNVTQKIIFELQHPIFMVVIAFATIVTGAVIRYRLILIGGIIFGLSALFSSYMSLQYQLLVEAFAWLIAFIVPGHILFSKRNK